MSLNFLTRRTFLKTVAAASVPLAAGCSRNDSGGTIYISENFDEDYTNPANLSAKYDYKAPSTSPHNCGGGCLMMAYVKDDTIVAIGPDESPDIPIWDEKTRAFSMPDRMDSPRSIPCLRCRAHRSLMYSANRLLYPMIQRGERGNLSTFEKVDWDTALNYLFDKIKTLRSNYGPGTFMKTQTTGAGGFETANFDMLYTTSGQNPTHRQNWSFAAYTHTMPFVTTTNSVPNASVPHDSFYSDYVIVWAHNIADNIQGADSMHRLTQLKESGVRVKMIDTWVCTTASTVLDNMAEDMYVIPPGTDTALIIGMMHTMLTKYDAELKTLWGANNDTDLWKNIGKLIYGFFDNNDTPKKISDANAQIQSDFNAYYQVPAGGSFSAYIFGSSNELVTRGLNKGTSIYPNHIHYNVWEHSDSRCFPAADAKTWCYGQVEKDAEWASKITGISKARIEELAYLFLTKDISVWLGYAINRNTEGDTEVWASYMLMALTRCFGGLKNGVNDDRCRTFGVARENKYNPAGPGSGWSSGAGTYGQSINQSDIQQFKVGNGGYLADANLSYGQIYDTSVLSVSSTPTGPRSGIPCFTVMDAIKATNSPKVTDPVFGDQVWKSEMNDGQVKHMKAPIKGLFNTAGGQPVNQYGDVHKCIEILTMKDQPGTGAYDKNCHPQKYSLELFAMADPMFTTTAQYADVILPVAMSFERDYVNNGGFGGGQHLRACVKVHEAPGEALSELYVNAKFAALFNKETEYYNTYAGDANESFEEKVARARYENSNSSRVMPYNVFRQKGVITAKTVKDAGLTAYTTNTGTFDTPAFIASVTSAAGVSAGSSVTGKFEAYCVSIVDDYRARYYNNVDSSISLVDNLQPGNKIMARSIPAADQGKGMFVYPVPMYVPLPEGIHANGNFKTVSEGNNDGIDHPDPLGLKAKGLNKYLCTYHPIYRCHSTHSNNPLVTDFYKKDKDGGSAYISYNETDVLNGGVVEPWKAGVYEPAFTNENTTYSDTGDKVRNGDLVMLESMTGKVKVVIQINNSIRPDTVFLPQGAWHMFVDGVDVGGNVNTLTSFRPCRISQGPAVSNDVRIKITKAD